MEDKKGIPLFIIRKWRQEEQGYKIYGIFTDEKEADRVTDGKWGYEIMEINSDILFSEEI